MAEGQSSLSSSLSEVAKSVLNDHLFLNGSSSTQPSSGSFSSRTSTQSKDDAFVTTGRTIKKSDIPSVPVYFPMFGRARPMLGVSMSSDLVSSTTRSIPVTSTSPVTLKPPRIVSLVSPTSPPTSSSSDSARHHPVATPTFSPCYLVDVEVRLKPGCADILLKDRVGVVRKVEGKTAMVHIKEHPSYITIPHESLVPVSPGRSDTVKVIGGNNGLVGLIGTLLSITGIGSEGLVQFLSWSNQRPRNPAQISLSHLGRYSPLTKFGSNSMSSVSPSGRVSSSDPVAPFSSSTRLLKATPSGFKLVPISKSFGQQSSKSSSTFPTSGLPVSFVTPPLSSQAMPKKTSPAPPHISSLPTNLSSRPYIIARGRTAESNIPLTYSALMYGRKNALQGGSIAQFSMGLNNGGIRNPNVSQVAAFQGATFQNIRSIPSCEAGLDKDSPRTSKENSANILLSKIAAMKNDFLPVSRGGYSEVEDLSEVLARLVKEQRDYLYELTTPTTPGGGSNLDVKASCVRVSFVCPLGQQRMKYPSRGRSCKHLQCFDAENYISFHRKLILRNRLKHSKGPLHKPPPLDKSWNCPICEKVAHLQHLYIDRSKFDRALHDLVKKLDFRTELKLERALMKLVQETNATEVELKDDGTWAPVEKNTENEVIDLTGDD